MNLETSRSFKKSAVRVFARIYLEERKGLSMDYSIKNEGTSKEVTLQGRLTFSDNASFRQIVAELKEFNGSSCVFDLSGLEFIDSAGLGMLMLVRDAVQGKSLNLSIKGAGGQVRRMLEIAKFDALIPISD